jgi:broad specificity phosphatase PhoE
MKLPLILIRHAHRDTADRSFDNGLSKKGKKQAQFLLSKYQSSFGKNRHVGAPAILLSSPKLRCVETLEPLSKKYRTKLTTTTDLLEHQAGESKRVFDARIDAVKKQVVGLMKRSVDEPFLHRPFVICSHGDWLEEAVKIWSGASVPCSKGSWVEFEVASGIFVLKTVMQSSDLQWT